MKTEDHIIDLPLAGVDSEHCALIVDKGLDKVEGITSHKVELNNNRAIITTDDDMEVVPRAVKAIRDLGYDVDTVKKTFPVFNMSCASCASSSQSMLENTPGVVNVAVNYANATAQVEYMPTITNPQKLKEAMQTIGYDLMIDETEEAKDALEEVHREKFAHSEKKNNRRHPIVHSAGYNRYVLHEYALCQLHYVGIGYTCGFYFWKQFFIGACKQVKHRSANMDTLVALSTGVAYLFSVFQYCLPGLLAQQGLACACIF